jgi:hypothetical protein
MKPEDKYATSAPRKGMTVFEMGKGFVGVVSSVDGAVCNYKRHDGTPNSFIWAFSDGLNNRHSWYSKMQNRDPYGNAFHPESLEGGA